MCARRRYPQTQPLKDFFSIDALPALQRLDALEQLGFEFFPCSRDRGKVLSVHRLGFHFALFAPVIG
jgi:hypothetical protein